MLEKKKYRHRCLDPALFKRTASTGPDIVSTTEEDMNLNQKVQQYKILRDGGQRKGTTQSLFKPFKHSKQIQVNIPNQSCFSPTNPSSSNAQAHTFKTLQAS